MKVFSYFSFSFFVFDIALVKQPCMQSREVSRGRVCVLAFGFCYRWHVTGNRWYVTGDMVCVTCDRWQETHNFIFKYFLCCFTIHTHPGIQCRFVLDQLNLFWPSYLFYHCRQKLSKKEVYIKRAWTWQYIWWTIISFQLIFKR